MVEKRARKIANVVEQIAPPELEGPSNADVTLLGWGSTYGVIKEHSGSIECKSGPDQGTRFTVSLPLPPRTEKRSVVQGAGN